MVWSRPFASQGAQRFALAVQWHPEWQVMEQSVFRRCLPHSARPRREYAQRDARRVHGYGE